MQHRAFVDPEDKKTREVRGIVQIQDVNGIERWLFIEHFLSAAKNSEIRKSNWTLWKKCLDSFYQIGNENLYYPLFAEVKVSPKELKELKDIPSAMCVLGIVGMLTLRVSSALTLYVVLLLPLTPLV